MAHIVIFSGNVVAGIRSAIDEGGQSQKQRQSYTHSQHCFIVFESYICICARPGWLCATSNSIKGVLTTLYGAWMT